MTSVLVKVHNLSRFKKPGSVKIRSNQNSKIWLKFNNSPTKEEVIARVKSIYRCTKINILYKYDW